MSEVTYTWEGTEFTLDNVTSDSPVEFTRLPNGNVAVYYVELEDCAEEPFEDDWARIFSFNRRHGNF